MRPGQLVGGRFRVERLAGVGGMGAVYRARDVTSGTTVALKIMRAGGTEHAERFAREARTLEELSHPAIVRHVAHGTDATGQLYLAMDWLEGEDLAQRLARGPLGVEETVSLARRISGALAMVHGRGVVHRDLKPHNLFLPGRDVGGVMLLDLGVARLRGAMGSMTRTGVAIGTPGYMAPEQAKGARDVDARADVFSLGCVLHECLTGKPLFVGAHARAILAKLALEDAPSVRVANPDVPAAIDDLVLRMLSKDRALRPADGEAVSEEIRRIDAGETTEAAAEPTIRPDPAIGHEERTLVTLVLAGTGDDATAATLSPEEDARGRAQVDAIATRFLARAERLADGSVFLVFTGTVATDMAARAARAALALRPVLADAPIAIATGAGLVAAVGIVGDVVDRAVEALHEERSGAGAILRVDETTAGLLGARFPLRRTLRRIELRTEGDLESRRVLGRPSPFVGRGAERARLRSMLEEGAEGARAALVVGPPGIGKSRLREALLLDCVDRHEPLRVWSAAGDPMRAAEPLGLIREALHSAIGLRSDQPVDVRRRLLAASVARSLPVDERARVAIFLGEIAGVPLEGADARLAAARGDPQLMADQMRRAWLDFVRAECAAHPLLVVVEDMHWADEASVGLFDAALRDLDEAPLVLLAFARSDVDDLFPELWAGLDVTRITLDAISDAAAGELARAVLGPGVDDARVGELVARAGGNPFYLEEMLRAAEDGSLASPARTVLAMVQARLAALSEDARRILRAASVFGRMFDAAGVAALAGTPAAPLAHAMSELTAHEIVVEASGDARGDHAFRHEIVRDAAYGTLTDADRVLGHRLAAAFLEGSGGAAAIVLAEHFDRGGEPERARPLYLEATAHALARSDLRATIAAADRAIACGAEGAARARARLAQAEAHLFRGEYDLAAARAGEARDGAQVSADVSYAAIGVAVAAASKTGQRAKVVELARGLAGERPREEDARHFIMASAQCVSHLLSLGEGALADLLLERVMTTPADGVGPLVKARVLFARAYRCHAVGDPAAFRALLLAAATLFDEAGDARLGCAVRQNAGYASMELGRYEDAEAELRDVARAAGAAGLLNTVAWAEHNLGLTLARRGAFAEARELERRAIDGATAQTDRGLEIASRVALARILLMEKDHPAVLEAAASAGAVAEGAPAPLAVLLASKAAALTGLGRHAEASLAAREAMASLAAAGSPAEDETFVRLAHAEALLGAGEASAARRAIDEARERLLARAARIGDPDLRDAFLRRVDENARTLALACHDAG